MTVPSLLPSTNSTAFMRALEQAVAYEARVTSGVDLIRNIKGRQLPSFVQFLLFEYGLIELTPYVENPYTLLVEGRPWQLERDTFAAILRGLGWVNAPAAIEEAATRRNWWNSFQLRFQSLPPNDSPALDRIDRITNLGKPFRSDFRRGVFGYDAPAQETDATRLDCCLLDQESGVKLRADGPAWSLGDLFEYGHTMTEAEGVALGNYVIPSGQRSIFLDFVAGEYKVADTDVPLSQVLMIDRSTPKTGTSSAGAVIDFAANVPAVVDRGLIYETAARNEIVNNSDGNAWVFPDDWEGLAASIVGQGAANGIPYTDIRVHGTAIDRRGLYIAFDAIDVASAIGLTWTASAFVAIVAGSTAGLEGFSLNGLDISGVGSTLSRRSVSGTVASIPVSPGIQFGYDIGNVIDITVRIGLPQVEIGNAATSVIRTTGEAETRSADAGVVHLPVGIHRLTVTFEDGSTQLIDGASGDYALSPATLAGSVIKKIEAVQLDGAESLRWIDLKFPWTEAKFPWVSAAGNARRIQMAAWFADRLGYLVLKRQDGSRIGYRRLRATRQVKSVSPGQYSIGGVPYVIADTGEFVFIDALTGFGDGAGEPVASIAFAFNVTVADHVPPGKLWLAPADIVSAVEIAEQPFATVLRKTVRERVKLLLRF